MNIEKKPFAAVGGQFVITSFNSVTLWKMACEMRDEARWVEKNPAGMSSRAVISVILSAAATEAFINELAAEVTNAPHSPSPNLVSFGHVMTDIEDNRGSVGLKYLVASLVLSGSMFDAGTNPYQDFDLLRRLRDLLMHVKSPDVLTEPPSSSTKTPKPIIALRQKGLTYALGTDQQTFWMNELQTYKLAAWACGASRNVILAILAMIPDDAGVSSGYLKNAFRDDRAKTE
jgi:hypothetical protein